jgi:hypothetical protein
MLEVKWNIYAPYGLVARSVTTMPSLGTMMNSLHVWGGKIKVYTEKGGGLCVHVYCVSAPKASCVARLSMLPGRTRTEPMHCKLEYLVKEVRRVLCGDSKRITKNTTVRPGYDGTCSRLTVCDVGNTEADGRM